MSLPCASHVTLLPFWVKVSSPFTFVMSVRLDASSRVSLLSLFTRWSDTMTFSGFPTLLEITYTVSSFPISFWLTFNPLSMTSERILLLSESSSSLSPVVVSFSVDSVCPVEAAFFAAATEYVDTPVPARATTRTPAIIRIVYLFLKCFFTSGNLIFSSSYYYYGIIIFYTALFCRLFLAETNAGCADHTVKQHEHGRQNENNYDHTDDRAARH